jgi:pimeloyl-ACP methyl ester carboxylesterase
MLAGAALLGALAAGNRWLARRAERRHPPAGRFVDVEGLQLHYIKRGAGSPIVLLHGNMTMAEDFAISGVLDRLAHAHRVIAFDRPGFGYSERPRERVWTAEAQAALLGRPIRRIGVHNPVLVGHS